MIVIQEVLVSEEVLDQQFICHLEACRGACCWEGDYGAPLEKEELATLEAIYPAVRPYLSPAGVAQLEAEGRYTYFTGMNNYGTTLLPNGACAYLVLDRDGKAQCGIEKAYNDGATTFKKPISCHLYPVRIKKNPQTGFEAMNYDEWDICAPACRLGRQMQFPLYQFLREAITRKYGENFYDELAAAAAYRKK